MEVNDSHERFTRLLIQHEPELLRCVLVVVPNRADAEDVFQEASVVLWRESDKFRPGTDFAPWALAIAFNQVRSYRHRMRRNRLMFNEVLVAELAAEENRLAEDLDSRSEALEKCLAKLAPRDVELVTAYYESNVTAKDVSQRLGRPINTVYKALQRIRRGLYQCIERRLAIDARS